MLKVLMYDISKAYYLGQAHSHSQTIVKLVDNYDALVSKHEVDARAQQEAKQWTIDLQKELQILSIWKQH